MPIEFTCAQCGHGMIVPDDASGATATCPECSATFSIPQATHNPFADAERIQVAAEIDPENPYAAPRTETPRSIAPASGADRDGPPWERDGKGLRTYWQTLRMVFLQPTLMFATMRRQGGVGDPILFCMVGAFLSAVAGGLVRSVWFAGMAFETDPQTPSAIAMTMMLTVAVVGLIFIPILLLFCLFLGSGLYHLLLVAFGERRFGFQTTFRVFTYCTGSVYLLGAIPICGQQVMCLLIIPYLIFGFKEAHEISIGKASLIVLLPFAICIPAVVGFGVYSFQRFL